MEFARRYPPGRIEASFTSTGDLGVGARSREAREAWDEARAWEDDGAGVGVAANAGAPLSSRGTTRAMSRLT
ncbi:hypothetical protein Airi01_065090 [Actinoallomurus iriomotensis]|uniref:Uncharacterized protein n=1 Tax=Actinoallomurus iriomotensis TaxID=478107 RepID=A0A9W6RQG3_9ACTN|nr:hypothetical protein Airi01_065090 [Actinoallomurus iriomotensis]